MIDYQRGLDEAVLVAAWPGGIVLGLAVLATAVALATSGETWTRIRGEGVGWVGLSVGTLFDVLLALLWAAVHCLLLSAALFNIAFPILNAALQEPPFQVSLQEEMRTGTLGLRVASVLLGLKVCSSLIGSFVPRRWDQRLGRRKNPLTWISPRLNEVSLSALLTLQTGTFLFATSALWWSLLAGVSDVRTATLGWLLFFIVDDWAILSDYLRALRGHLLWSHALRLIAADVALLVLLTWIFLSEGGPPAALPSTALLLLFVLFDAGLLLAAATKAGSGGRD